MSQITKETVSWKAAWPTPLTIVGSRRRQRQSRQLQGDAYLSTKRERREEMAEKLDSKFGVEYDAEIAGTDDPYLCRLKSAAWFG